MTENERAATFIGWKPGMVHRLVSMGITTVSVLCDADDPRAQPLEAPDMSDPCNYMRALEGLPHNTCWSIDCVVPRVRVRIWNRAGMFVSGGNAREALAALWDAENGTKNS